MSEAVVHQQYLLTKAMRYDNWLRTTRYNKATISSSTVKGEFRGARNGYDDPAVSGVNVYVVVMIFITMQVIGQPCYCLFVIFFLHIF